MFVHSKGLRKHLKGSLTKETAVYYAISDNQRAVGSFIHWSKRILFKWVNRKGGRPPNKLGTVHSIAKIVELPRALQGSIDVHDWLN